MTFDAGMSEPDITEDVVGANFEEEEDLPEPDEDLVDFHEKGGFPKEYRKCDRCGHHTKYLSSVLIEKKEKYICRYCFKDLMGI